MFKINIETKEQKLEDMEVETNQDEQKDHKKQSEASSSKKSEDYKKNKTERAEKLKKVIQYGIDLQKEKYAKCKLCPRSKDEKRIIKMKFGNTSGLRRHLKTHHKEVYEDIYGPILPSKSDKSKDQFDQDRFDRMLTDLAVKKYLSFDFFDDENMKNMFLYLNPEVKVPQTSRMKSLIFSRFNEMQEVILEILKENRSKIAFTLDGWTSITNKSYCGITGHFFDDEWVLHSLIIDFLPSHGNSKGKDLAKLFLDDLQKYGLVEKLQGITADNTSTNTTFLDQLFNLISSMIGSSFDSQNLQFQCFAHGLKLAVQEMLRKLDIDDVSDETDESVEKFGESDEDDEDDGDDEADKELKVIPRLRKLFRKIRRSEELREKLKCCCVTVSETMVSLNIDVSTSWYSTHRMIKTASRMKKALDLLCMMNPSLQKLSIRESEWQLLNEFQKYLRHFKALSHLLSEDKYVPFPSVVVGFNLLLDKIESSILTLNLKWNITDTELKLIEALQSALEQLLKHYRKANWIYSAVLILDPRHRFITFKMTDWGKEMAKEARQKFEKLYEDFYLPSQVQNELVIPVKNNEDIFSDDEELDVNCLYTDQTYSGGWREEFESYLSSPRVDGKVDINQWWKQNSSIFPNLSRMARDLLAIQSTSVTAKRFFSPARVMIRKNRKRIDDESTRACISLNSWVNCSLTPTIRARLEAKKQSTKVEV